jgi:predicted MFS family arabinose efflux permease
MSDGSGAGAADGVRARLVLTVLAAVQVTNIIDFMIVMPLGPRLMEGLGINPRQFGWVVASYTYAACAAGLLASSLVDRFDRRTAFLTLYTGFLVGTFLCALAPGYGSLLAARVVTGAFGGILGGLAMTIVGDVFPEHRRGAAMGALMSAFSVASVVGVPFGLWLGNHYGWHAPFFMLAALGLGVLALGARALPPLRSHLTAVAHAHPLLEMRATLFHPDHLRAFALMVALMVGAFSVVPYISPYLVANVGVRNEDLFWVYVAGGGLTLFAAPVIGKLADRLGKFRVYRVAAPVAALFMLMVTNLPRVPLPLAVAAVGALMVGNAGRMVVAMTMITSCVAPRRRGSFLSLNSAVQHFASGLGANVGGLIVGTDTSGAFTHYERVGLFAAVLTIASVALAARLRPYEAPATAEDVAETLPAFEV